MLVTCLILVQFVGVAIAQGSIVLFECDYFPEDPGPFDGCEWERSDFYHGEENMASVPDPDGTSDVVRVFYPEGSYAGLGGEMKGGLEFYGTPFDGADHITFEYQVYLSEDFEFVKGGKLPGLFGGSYEGSLSCSGGGLDPPLHCFSTRFHWREEGLVEIYGYIPVNDEDTSFCDDPTVICDFKFGHSFGRGAFSLVLGSWQTIAMDIQLNDPGEANGGMSMFYNGENVYTFGGLTFRRDVSMEIDQIFFSTFFGGSTDESFASEDDVYIYYKDFKVLGY